MSNESRSQTTYYVKYSDQDLNVEVCDKNSEAVAYGGAEMSEEMKDVLTCNPKM